MLGELPGVAAAAAAVDVCDGNAAVATRLLWLAPLLASLRTSEEVVAEKLEDFRFELNGLAVPDCMFKADLSYVLWRRCENPAIKACVLAAGAADAAEPAGERCAEADSGTAAPLPLLLQVLREAVGDVKVARNMLRLCVELCSPSYPAHLLREDRLCDRGDDPVCTSEVVYRNAGAAGTAGSAAAASASAAAPSPTGAGGAADLVATTGRRADPAASVNAAMLERAAGENVALLIGARASGSANHGHIGGDAGGGSDDDEPDDDTLVPAVHALLRHALGKLGAGESVLRADARCPPPPLKLSHTLALWQDVAVLAVELLLLLRATIGSPLHPLLIRGRNGAHRRGRNNDNRGGGGGGGGGGGSGGDDEVGAGEDQGAFEELATTARQLLALVSERRRASRCNVRLVRRSVEFADSLVDDAVLSGPPGGHPAARLLAERLAAMCSRFAGEPCGCAPNAAPSPSAAEMCACRTVVAAPLVAVVRARALALRNYTASGALSASRTRRRVHVRAPTTGQLRSRCTVPSPVAAAAAGPRGASKAKAFGGRVVCSAIPASYLARRPDLRASLLDALASLRAFTMSAPTEVGSFVGTAASGADAAAPPPRGRQFSWEQQQRRDAAEAEERKVCATLLVDIEAVLTGHLLQHSGGVAAVLRTLASVYVRADWAEDVKLGACPAARLLRGTGAQQLTLTLTLPADLAAFVRLPGGGVDEVPAAPAAAAEEIPWETLLPQPMLSRLACSPGRTAALLYFSLNIVSKHLLFFQGGLGVASSPDGGVSDVTGSALRLLALLLCDAEAALAAAVAGGDGAESATGAPVWTLISRECRKLLLAHWRLPHNLLGVGQLFALCDELRTAAEGMLTTERLLAPADAKEQAWLLTSPLLSVAVEAMRFLAEQTLAVSEDELWRYTGRVGAAAAAAVTAEEGAAMAGGGQLPAADRCARAVRRQQQQAAELRLLRRPCSSRDRAAGSAGFDAELRGFIAGHADQLRRDVRRVLRGNALRSPPPPPPPPRAPGREGEHEAGGVGGGLAPDEAAMREVLCECAEVFDAMADALTAHEGGGEAGAFGSLGAAEEEAAEDNTDDDGGTGAASVRPVPLLSQKQRGRLLSGARRRYLRPVRVPGGVGPGPRPLSLARTSSVPALHVAPAVRPHTSLGLVARGPPSPPSPPSRPLRKVAAPDGGCVPKQLYAFPVLPAVQAGDLGELGDVRADGEEPVCSGLSHRPQSASGGGRPRRGRGGNEVAAPEPTEHLARQRRPVTAMATVNGRRPQPPTAWA